MKLMTKELLAKMPKLYAQDGKGGDAIAYVHYFIGGCDWWLTEFDPEEGMFFGLCSIHTAELGYVSLFDLQSIRGIERDLYFNPTPLKEIRPEIFR